MVVMPSHQTSKLKDRDRDRDRDSDSDYGYDLSPEDEEALNQLASTYDIPVIDAIPSKTDSVAGDDLDFDDAFLFEDSAFQSITSRLGDNLRRSEDHTSHAQPLPSPVSLIEDIKYPDCMMTHVLTSSCGG